MCLCFVDGQRVFDPFDSPKLLGMFKNIGADRREHRIIRNLYIGQRMKFYSIKRETDSVEIGTGIRQGYCTSPILFYPRGEYLMKKALAWVVDFNAVGRVIHKIRFADDTNIAVKFGKSYKICWIVDAGRKYGMEIKINK